MNDIFDLLSLITSNVWIYGGSFLIVLSILVFVHEWGHYIVARLCGVRVEVFSIGFGKEIFGFDDKRGTRWKFSLIPLGGYVKMFGDQDPASAKHSYQVEGEEGEARPLSADERKQAFFAKPVAQRAAIVFAGPAINFIFAIILLAGLYMAYGKPVTPPLAAAIIEGGAADEAGFLPHDKVLKIDGQRVISFQDLRRRVMIALDRPLNFTVLRDGEEIEITASPKKEELEDRFGFSHSRGMIGIIGPGNGVLIENIVSIDGRPLSEDIEAKKRALKSRIDQPVIIGLKRSEEQTDFLKIKPLRQTNENLFDPAYEGQDILIMTSALEDDIVRYNPLSSTVEATKETGRILGSTLEALGQMITGTRSAKELGGIIRIGAIAGDMAQAGFIALITFTALLSINLGLINLFPLPMLDGGHLVFYAIEAVKGSPLSENVQEYAFRFGLVVLIGIMAFANLNDIVQLIF